jgi:outer membrane murein-binding lipoprotein Lpp
MLRFIAVFVGIACLIGCASAPVQEMSDARQAIAAARVAGATEANSPDLYAAAAAIARAEQHLQAQEYTRARLAATQAKRHAGAALLVRQRGDGTVVAAPPPVTPAATTPATPPP